MTFHFQTTYPRLDGHDHGLVLVMSSIVRYCIGIGYADGAYIYSRMLVRYLVAR